MVDEKRNDDVKEAAAEQGKPEGAKEEPGREAKEQMMRIAAEFENYKKRTAKESERARDLAMADFAKKLLPIVDEFYLAALAARSSEDKNLSRGIEMLYANFMELLKREGLKAIGAEGSYDPYMHEIVMMQESERAPGSIIEVVKEGYTFKGILLRPAAVIVASEAKAEGKEDGDAPKDGDGMEDGADGAPEGKRENVG